MTLISVTWCGIWSETQCLRPVQGYISLSCYSSNWYFVNSSWWHVHMPAYSFSKKSWLKVYISYWIQCSFIFRALDSKLSNCLWFFFRYLAVLFRTGIIVIKLRVRKPICNILQRCISLLVKVLHNSFIYVDFQMVSKVTTDVPIRKLFTDDTNMN